MVHENGSEESRYGKDSIWKEKIVTEIRGAKAKYGKSHQVHFKVE